MLIFHNNYGGLNISNKVRYRYIYSDSHISDFLASVTDNKRIGFLNDWNSERDHREKIYISYDSTNKIAKQGI